MSILILELDAYVDGAETTLYYAEKTITTSPTDAPANTTYRGLISDAGQFSRSVSILGQVSESRGGIALNNADGALDFLYSAGAGRAFRLKELASKAALVSSAPIIASGVWLGADASSPFTEIRLRIRDAMEKLKTPLLIERYLGTTNDGTIHTAEGDATQKDKFKPLVVTSRSNITPVLVDKFNLVYQVSYRAVSSITVFDRAVALTFSADYANLAALLAATVPAGSYATCLAEGLFKIGASPVGLITADAVRGSTSDRSAARAAEFIIAMLNEDGAGIAYDEDSFDELHDFNSSEVELYVETDTNADELLTSVLGWIGGAVDPGTDGVLRVFPIEVPSGTPGRTFTIRDMVEANFAFMVNPDDEGGSTPAWSIDLQYGGVATVQDGTDLDGTAADPDRIILIGEETQSATASDEDVLDVFPNAVTVVVETGIRFQVDAEEEAARRLEFFKVRRDRNALTVSSEIGRVEMGSVQAIRLNRFGYSSGKNFLVVGISENFKTRRITLQLLG